MRIRETKSGYWTTKEGITKLNEYISEIQDSDFININLWRTLILEAIPDLLAAIKKQNEWLPKRLRISELDPPETKGDEARLSEMILDDDDE